MNFRTFDLNLLRVLDALLSEKSTVRAGARLGLSQPAVSAALGRLRDTLGDQLFFRRGQGMEPTDFAIQLEIPLRRALEDMEILLSGSDTFDPSVSEAQFRLSGSDFFAEILMPQLADRLAARAPGMKVHLVDLVPDNHIDTLEHYDVDIALIPATPAPDWIQSQKVFNSPFIAITRKAHPRLIEAGVAPGGVIPLDLFCSLGHVLFSPEGKDRAMGDDALEAVGRSRRVVMTMPVFSGVYRAVAGSDLIAMMPEQLARHVAEPAGLDLYQIPVPVASVDIAMIWHRRNAATPDHMWLRSQISELLAPLNDAQQN